MNKKGQEGMTLTTLLAIIVGVVAVVLIVMFSTGFFSKLNGGTNQLPSDLQAAVSACEISGSSGLTADYCSTFRQVTIDGTQKYVTCNNPSITKLMDQSKLLSGSCKDVVTNATAFCAAKKLTSGTMVVGLDNVQITCTGKY